MFYRREIVHVDSEAVLRRRELGVKLMRLLLLILFLLCGYSAYRGPSPWSRTVVDRIERAAVEHGGVDAASLKTLPGWIRSGVEHPGVLRPKEHALIGWWWAAVSGAGIAFLLLLTLSVWMPMGQHEGDEIHNVAVPEDEATGDGGFSAVVSGRPLFYLMAIAAVLVGGGLRAYRLDHSLWNDEEYAMRKFAHGDYQKDSEGRPVFHPTTWQETLAENGNGNNHVLHSVLSRLSLTAWRGVWGHGPDKFSETWLRMPSYLAGLGTIFVIALIGAEFGLSWVGIGAAFLLALHPWHMRFAAEAKGYSLMMFSIGLCVLGLIRAQRTHSLRAWLLFAVGEVGILTSFLGAIYVVVALNVMAIIELLLRRQPRRFAALIAFNLLAAVPVMWLMLPSVPQVLGFIAHDNSARLVANMDWLRDLGAHLAAGVLYANPMPSSHAGTSWEMLYAAHPLVLGPLGWFLGLLVALGVVTAAFESAATRFAIVALVLAGGLGFVHARLQHHPNLTWYYLYLLFPLCLAAALAIVRLGVMPAALMAIAVGLFGYATEVPRGVVLNVDRQPIRQTVAAIRDLRPFAYTGVFGVSDKQAESYDPSVTVLSSLADLEALAAKAKLGNNATFVYFAGERETANRSPELLKAVTESGAFELFKEFKATEALFSYKIYHLVGVGD